MDHRIERTIFVLLFLTILLVSASVYFPHARAATTFFSDGFNSGNFNTWTGTTKAPMVQSTTYHHNSTYPYAMLADSPEEDCFKALGKSYSILYMQFYVYISTLPTSGNYILLAEVGQSGTYWGYGTYVGIRYYSGSARFALRNGYLGTWVNTNVFPKTNTWYCVQIKAAQNETQILYINDTQVATMGQGYLGLNQVRVGTFESTYSVNVHLDCVVIADARIAMEEEEPPPAPEKIIYRLSINSTFHDDYGLGYPVTYVFQIPSASNNLKVYKRHTMLESWTQLTERNASEFFNGIECVRFDYSQNKAYVSIAFSATSDDIYIRITDQNGELVETLFSAVSKYYDNRKATVAATGDDWEDDPWHTAFLSACDVFQSKRVWFTPGIMTYSCDSTVWSGIQTQLNEGYVEASSHSRTHPNSLPYANYDSEIAGSRNDIIGNLSLPTMYTKGSSEYVWAWLEPADLTDSTIRTKLGKNEYLIDRHSGYPPGFADFASWDSTNRLYNRIGVTAGADSWTLTRLNSVFDASYSAGEIYHLFFHPLGLDWSPAGKISRHLDHLKDKLDVWYVGFGALYAYQSVKENYRMQKIPWVPPSDVYTLTLTIVGSGSVSKVPDQATYTWGTNVTLTASADVGWTLASWAGDASGAANLTTVNMTGNKVVTATFIQGTYTITASVDGVGGTIDPSGAVSVNGGETITFTVTPDGGYHILNVLVDGTYMGPQSSFTFYEVDSDHIITAFFAKNEYTLTIIIVGAGSVSINPNKISYSHGDVVELTAIPNSKRYQFAYWSGNLTGNTSPATIIMDGNKTVTAIFTRKPKW